MAHDVFISYSHRNKTVADTVCGGLEGAGIRCWMAPRDVIPGDEWGDSIIRAIGASRVMVIVFSSHTNGSKQVLREVERAVSKGITIIPFRIEEVVPTGSMEYFLGTPHWLDALTPPLERHVNELARFVRLVLDRSTDATSDSTARREGPVPNVTGTDAPLPDSAKFCAECAEPVQAAVSSSERSQGAGPTQGSAAPPAASGKSHEEKPAPSATENRSRRAPRNRPRADGSSAGRAGAPSVPPARTNGQENATTGNPFRRWATGSVAVAGVVAAVLAASASDGNVTENKGDATAESVDNPAVTAQSDTLTTAQRQQVEALRVLDSRLDSIKRIRGTPAGHIRTTSTDILGRRRNRRVPVYWEFQVDTKATPLASNPSPSHPEALRSAKVEGEVVAVFAVNRQGRVEMGTFRIFRSSHDLFSEAVKEVMPRLRFSPARKDGDSVWQVVRMPFKFSPPN